MRVGIIGTGVVGSTLAIKLAEKGYQLGYIANRTKARAVDLMERTGAMILEIPDLIEKSEVVFITTPDSAIEPLVHQFADYFGEQHLVIHCSGALSSQVLQPVRDKGGSGLSIHPLQSFANTEVALRKLEGTHFSIEGDRLDIGAELVRDLGGIAHVCSAQGKVQYHAGACFVSNYLAVLAEIGVNLFELAGFPKEEAMAALLPLMQGTVDNLRNVGLPGALTGPISRGDVGVVESHLDQLPEDYRQIYRLLGVQAVELGRGKGTLQPEAATQIKQVLTGR